MSTINDRLKIILNAIFKGNVSEFARKVDIPQPTLNNIVGNRLSKPSAYSLEKIINSIETLSAEWLLTGKGGMYIKPANERKEDTNALQHYTSARGLLGILYNMKLSFSMPENSKDIKEKLLYQHPLFKNTKQAKEYKYLSFCLKNTQRNVDHPQMWAYYGDNHQGACIEFDKSKLMEKNPSLEFFDIKYEDYFVKEKKSIQEELMHKHSYLSEDHECRIIFKGKKNFINIEDCITCIYLGCFFDRENIQKLCKLIETKNNSEIQLIHFSKIISTGIGFLKASGMGDSMILSEMLPYFSEDYRNWAVREYDIDRKVLFDYPPMENKFLNYSIEQLLSAEDNEINVDYKEKFNELKNKLDKKNEQLTEILLENRDLHNKKDELAEIIEDLKGGETSKTIYTQQTTTTQKY
jgi:hypothetical protein